MAILGIGIDIVWIERIRKIYHRHPERFERRLLHANEQVEFHQASDPAIFLAKRFAAKEAIAKAMGTGIAQGIRFTDFQIIHGASGQPLVELGGCAENLVEKQGGSHFHLSIADESEYAVAFAVLEST